MTPEAQGHRHKPRWTVSYADGSGDIVRSGYAAFTIMRITELLESLEHGEDIELVIVRDHDNAPAPVRS